MTFGEAIQLAMFEGKKVAHSSFLSGKFIHLYNGYLRWNDGKDVGNGWSPVFKNGWSIIDILTIKELEPGDKFTIVNASGEAEGLVYTRTNDVNRPMYEGYKLATVVEDCLVERVV